jgi:hypothetical protein
MVHPIKINASLLTKYLEAVGDRMCDFGPAVIERMAKADKYFKAPPVDKGEKLAEQRLVLPTSHASHWHHWLRQPLMIGSH